MEKQILVTFRLTVQLRVQINAVIMNVSNVNKRPYLSNNNRLMNTKLLLLANYIVVKLEFCNCEKLQYVGG